MKGINIDNGKITFNPMGIILEDRIVPEAVTEAMPVKDFAPASEPVSFDEQGNQVEFGNGVFFGDPAAKLAFDKIKSLNADKEVVAVEPVVDYVAPVVSATFEPTC